MSRFPGSHLGRGKSALGHVWMAPWQELSDVSAALVGCGHVSGLLMRPVWPLALMLCVDRVAIVRMHLKVPVEWALSTALFASVRDTQAQY